MQTVVCRVHGQETAQEVVRKLQEGGFAPSSVEVQGALRAAWHSMQWIRKGDSLVVVRTADEHAPRAAAILKKAGAESIKTRPARLRH